MATTPALTRKAGPVGGLSGAVRDMDITGITRIVKISVQHSINIDAIEVTFLRDGVEESTGHWGGGAPKVSEFYLQPSEYITSVKGHIGTYQQWVVVKSLTFETNLQSYGPFGPKEGVPFELPAIGGKIIGFHGRVEEVVDAIGVYMQVPSQPLIRKIGPVGGGHGSTPYDMDTSGISRIVKISLTIGNGYISSLALSFIRDGREESAGPWGILGPRSAEFHLQPNEYITSVKGEIGDLDHYTVIFSLTFETNLGSYGPHGPRKGIPFELPAFGGQIIGFHGRAGGTLDSLGVYVKANTMTSSSSGSVSTVKET